jgi:16S rRNA (cytosine967-C5)-methyltransferase
MRRQLKNSLDWVMLDVPCTGTGVIRKNPDLKWKFTEERLHEMVQMQELILKDSIGYVKKPTPNRQGGKIVYSTCSVLQEENLM